MKFYSLCTAQSIVQVMIGIVTYSTLKLLANMKFMDIKFNNHPLLLVVVHMYTILIVIQWNPLKQTPLEPKICRL